MPIRKLYILLFFLCLAITGSVAAWFYIWDDIPKKSPAKAKQVYIVPYSDNIAKYNTLLFAQNNIGFTF